MEENTMRSLFEELGGTYTLGKDGMYYPNLAIEETDQRSIGKWAQMAVNLLYVNRFKSPVAASVIRRC